MYCYIPQQMLIVNPHSDYPLKKYADGLIKAESTVQACSKQNYFSYTQNIPYIMFKLPAYAAS
jgi:hypothetical protein